MYYLFNLIEFLYPFLPFKEKIKEFLAWLFYKLDNKRKKVIKTNLYLAFGKVDEEIVKKCYYNFINNLFEFIEVSHMNKDDLAKKVEFENFEEVKEILKEKPVIFVGAHFGNWELMPISIGAFLTPISAVVRDIDDKRLNEKIKKIREKFNVKIVSKKGALKTLMKDLTNKRSIGLLVDQNTAKEEGVETTFFGKRVLQTPSAVLLAKKFNVPIVMGFMEKRDNKWVLSVKDIFYVDDIQEAVNRQSKVIEEEVRKFPELYYWFHRRFKHFYEEEYNKVESEK